jgi:hypothetical protein
MKEWHFDGSGIGSCLEKLEARGYIEFLFQDSQSNGIIFGTFFNTFSAHNTIAGSDIIFFPFCIDAFDSHRTGFIAGTAVSAGLAVLP